MSAFSEFLAGRVLELEKELAAARHRETDLRRSRDLWRTRALNKHRKESTSGRRARVGL